MLDNAADMRESNVVTLKTTLSQMRDVDYADALSQYQLEKTALQAAQTLFSQMQQMSQMAMAGCEAIMKLQRDALNPA